MNEVSVIVLTYNADWNKLRVTLNSVLLQKNVDFQVVIADDGSKVRFDDQIKELFTKFGFRNFAFANSEENGGTVKNIYNALKYADGAYIKPISPGDFFYNDTSLSAWVDFMKETNSSFSFGDAVYYNNMQEIDIVKTTGSPSRKDLFKKPQNRKKLFESYLLANDTILGAAIMAEKSLYEKYIDKIAGRLIYAEDYLARLLVFDGVEIDYFPEIVIWYEYGTGASSGVNEKWVALLHKDFDESNRIILESDFFFDDLSEKYFKFLKESNGFGIMHKLKKCAAFPGLITARLDKSGGAATPTDVDKQFLSEII